MSKAAAIFTGASAVNLLGIGIWAIGVYPHLPAAGIIGMCLHSSLIGASIAALYLRPRR